MLTVDEDLRILNCEEVRGLSLRKVVLGGFLTLAYIYLVHSLFLEIYSVNNFCVIIGNVCDFGGF